MTKKIPRNNNSKHLSDAIIVAIVAGIFAVITTVLTVAPNWVATLKSNKSIFGTPTPTWPAFPLFTDPVHPTAAAASLRLSNFELIGTDSFIPSNYKPSDLLNTPVHLRTASTSSGITLTFNVTSISQKEWIKVNNYFLLFVENLSVRPPGGRDDILKGSPVGGGSSYTNFNLSIKGVIKPGDTLISPPSPNVDFFSLMPGEKMVFKIMTRLEIPSGTYNIRFGLTYEYGGEIYTIWSNAMTIISPQNPVFWTYENGHWVTSATP